MQPRASLNLAATLSLALWAQGAVGAVAPPGSSLGLRFMEPGRMTLQRTARLLPSTGDPIWQLRLEIPGEKPRAFEALVGRAARQRGDRNSLGSQAPLPPGGYHVSEIVALGQEKDLNPELGKLFWIGLEPDFPTGRKGLGIHLDPSAGKPENSGTDGCIGLIHPQELLALQDLLQRSGTTNLRVVH
jgi:hypothetical protein